MAPSEVNAGNQRQVYNNIVRKANIKLREPILVGDRVRVQLKKKEGITKGYKPKFSKEVYTVSARDGKYYIIDELARKYLRAFLQKVGEVEVGISPIDSEGTKEGFLKELAKRPVDPESIQNKAILQQEVSAHPVSDRIRRTKKIDYKKLHTGKLLKKFIFLLSEIYKLFWYFLLS